MHASLRTALRILALISTASAVQLANFQTLTISNAQCRAAYTTNIQGCQASDFEPNGSSICTEACVAGLQKIGDVVKRVCKDVDLGDASIIGVFKLDVGVRSLCPRVASASSSAKAPEKTSAQPPPPSPASSKAASSSAAPPPPESSTLVTSSSEAASSTTPAPEASSSQSDATQSTSTSSQGLIVDPNPTSISVAPPPASPTNAPAPSRATIPQLSNADSGGGSPFDVQAGTGASSQIRAFDSVMAALVGTALLFSVCA